MKREEIKKIKLDAKTRDRIEKSIIDSVYSGDLHGGLHAHSLIRSEFQTLSDGRHNHVYLIPTIGAQPLVVTTHYDGQHRHPMDDPAGDATGSKDSDHKHVVKIYADAALHDGTEIKAGSVFLTEQDGAHDHGAGALHRTDHDGQHKHDLILGGDMRIESLDAGDMYELFVMEKPVMVIKEAAAAELTDRDLAAAVLGYEIKKEHTDTVLKEEDMQELLFSSSKFKDEKAVAEWMVENGFQPGIIDKVSGGHKVQLFPVTVFDQATTKKVVVGAGVKAVVGNRKETIVKQTEVQSLLFPKDKFTVDQAKAWIKQQNGKFKSGKVDEPEDGKTIRFRQSDPGLFKRFRTITLPKSGGVKAVIGVRKQRVENKKRTHKELDRVLKSLDETVQIVKEDDEKQIVYGIVLEPETVDHEGDIISKDEIEKAAHSFMKNGAVIKFRHKRKMKTAKAVESFITPSNATYSGMHGKQKVKKGSWVLGVHIDDASIWSAVKDKTLNGFSIGGDAYRTPTKS